MTEQEKAIEELGQELFKIGYPNYVKYEGMPDITEKGLRGSKYRDELKRLTVIAKALSSDPSLQALVAKAGGKVMVSDKAEIIEMNLTDADTANDFAEKTARALGRALARVSKGGQDGRYRIAIEEVQPNEY